MSAARHIHPDQLRMLMRPDEIKSFVDSSVDRHEGESMRALWADKGNNRLRHRIATEGGVHKPVIIQHEWNGEKLMGNGHHRVENTGRLASATGREMYVPVVHDDHYMGNDDTLKYMPQLKEDPY